MLLVRLARFFLNTKGNVITTFALAIIPVVAGVGAAVDYSRANSLKAALQASIDAAALALSKDAQKLSTAQLNSRALALTLANLATRKVAKDVTVQATFTDLNDGTFKLNLIGKAFIDTTVAAMIIDKLQVGADAQVIWGYKRLELALALDNTGSMATSNKMTELKKAAKALLDTLENAGKKKDDIKIAIIPFDTTVNLGKSFKDQDWFDIESLDCNGWKAGSGCDKNNWKSKWEGCVRDRTYPYDTQDDAPTSANTKFPVYDCGTLAEMMPLNSDFKKLAKKIDEMQPNGLTNVTIGLIWAWHALTANAPLTEASAPKSDLDKVIILLTDGDNTESWKNSNNSTVTTASAIDARTKLACDNIKAAGIKIYTIRVIDGNAPLLSQCASRSNMYFDVQNASQLNDVFKSISQSLASLRLSN